MITEGTVCIWQNQVGEDAYLNGQETTVVKGLHYVPLVNMMGYDMKLRLVYATDTKDHLCTCGNCFLYAGPDELRPKDGPDEDELEDLNEVLLIECGILS